MKIYNTLSREIEEFIPQVSGQIKMYVCGPTVYNYIHIGNARSVVAFDVIRRYLEYKGFDVNYVSNFTDVDDKIIKGAKGAGLAPQEFTQGFIEAFQQDVLALNVKPATQNPQATGFIDQIIDFISVLIEKNAAYESQGDIYFRVSQSKNYGKLANKKLSDLIIGASGRIDQESETAKKESPLDFALWKAVRDGSLSWESPWGEGRPGWHIECSVMATEILGETLDIHAGGADLEFPHHTNEIAQSEAKTGKKFANYWMHNGFVNVDNQKMSKSLGNFQTVHGLLETIDARVLRFFLAATHYRKPINFSMESLTDAQHNLQKIDAAYRNLPKASSNLTELEIFKTRFLAEMDEDFNVANALSVLYDFISWVNSGNGGPEVEMFFKESFGIFGLTFERSKESLAEDLEELIKEREAARKQRDFAKSDEIRDQLLKRGIILEDTAEGVRWHKK